jgi:hypothetical protein
MKIYILTAVYLLWSLSLLGQKLDKKDQQESWNKRVFSIEDFINKFNGSIDLNNENITDDDEKKNRQIQTILYLINDDEHQLFEDSIKAFVLASIGEKGTKKIGLTNQDCYAEVTFSSTYNGRQELIKGYFSLTSGKDQTQHWSMEGLASSTLGNFTAKKNQLTFPPNSHGNDFGSVSAQLSSKIGSNSPQPNSKLLQEMKGGKIKINQVTNVTYHFFQVKNWYFMVSEYNKKNQLSGWLIRTIKYIPDPEKSTEKKKIIPILKSS